MSTNLEAALKYTNTGRCPNTDTNTKTNTGRFPRTGTIAGIGRQQSADSPAALLESYTTDVLTLEALRRELDDACDRIASGQTACAAELSGRASRLTAQIDRLSSRIAAAENLASGWRREDTLAPHPRTRASARAERLFVRLRYIQGMTIEETCEKMNISRETAYRINRRIRARR